MTIANCSALSTRWYVPSGIRWNGTTLCPVARDTCPFGPWTTVVCCTSVWVSSRAEKSQNMSPVWPSTRMVTFLPVIATGTSSFGAEVISGIYEISCNFYLFIYLKQYQLIMMFIIFYYYIFYSNFNPFETELSPL